MAVRKKKAVAKSAAIAKTLESSVSSLVTALELADKAVKSRAAESKKMLKETSRLKKRRLTLAGKKKRATAAAKKNSTAETRKAVKAITAELGTTGKTLAKAVAGRQAVLQELSGLKASLKQLSGYVKGITATDKQIAKPKRRRARRKAK